MKKKSILSGLYIALFGFVTASYAMVREQDESWWQAETESQTDSETYTRYLIEQYGANTMALAEYKQNRARKRPVLKAVTSSAAGTLGGLALIYSMDPGFKSVVNAKSESTKHLVLQKAVVPAIVKLRDVKRGGISGKDLLKVGAVAAGAYAVKKTADFFSIWRACKGDLTGTRRAMWRCMSYIANHKVQFSMAALAVAGAFGGLKLWKTFKNNADVDLADQFLLTLTSEQRKKIRVTPGLARTIGQINSDPTSITSDEPFMSLLSAKQKELLQRIVEEYISDNPHLALID